MSSQPYPNPQAIFQQQYAAVRRDELAGILFALFLGGFGVHHFYLRRTGLGILYCLLSEFNAIQAAGIAAMLGISVPGWGQPFNVTVNVPESPQAGTLTACTRCRQVNPQGARFCSGCGAAL
jgi:hypothetical protein